MKFISVWILRLSKPTHCQDVGVENYSNGIKFSMWWPPTSMLSRWSGCIHKVETVLLKQKAKFIFHFHGWVLEWVLCTATEQVPSLGVLLWQFRWVLLVALGVHPMYRDMRCLRRCTPVSLDSPSALVKLTHAIDLFLCTKVPLILLCGKVHRQRLIKIIIF